MKTIQTHVLEWLQWLRVKNYSPRSVQTYEYRIRRFVAHINASGMKDVRLADRDFLRRYWQSVLTLPKTLSVNSLGGECRVVKGLFSYLLESGQIKSDPSAVLVDPSKRGSLPKTPPSYADVKKVLEQPDLSTLQGIRDRACLELLFSSAVRVGECEALLLGDVDLQSGILRVRQGKGQKERLCPLGVHASRYLRLYLDQARPYYRLLTKTDWDSFFLSRKGGRLRAGDIRFVMRRYRVKAGVGNLVTPHGLRRAAATGMISRSGKTAADIGAMQALLGHTRIAVTARYAQVAGEDLKDIHQTLHPRAQSVEQTPDRPILRLKSVHV